MTIRNTHDPLSKAGADWLLAVANPLHISAHCPAPAPREVPSILRAAELHGVLPAALRALSLTNELSRAVLNTEGSIEVQAAKRAISDARTRQIHQAGFELMLRHHGDKACAALQTAGVAAAVVKGPTFARRLYAERAMRPFTDIDILIPFEARAAASKVMPSIGFELQKPDYRAGKDYHEDRWLLADDPRIAIEIHCDLVHNPTLRRAASVTFAAVTEAGGGDPEDATAILFVAAAHGAIGHQFDRLQHLVDVALAANGAAGEVAVERLSAIAHASGVMSAVHGALVLTGAAFESARCLAMAKALRPSVLDTLAAHLVTPNAVLAARSSQRSNSSWRRKALRQAIRLGGFRRPPRRDHS